MKATTKRLIQSFRYRKQFLHNRKFVADSIRLSRNSSESGRKFVRDCEFFSLNYRKQRVQNERF